MSKYPGVQRPGIPDGRGQGQRSLFVRDNGHIRAQRRVVQRLMQFRADLRTQLNFSAIAKLVDAVGEKLIQRK